MTLSAGQVPTGDEWDLEFLAGSVIARGSRQSASSGSSGTEVAYHRVDGIAVKSGRLYEITCSSFNIDGSSNGDQGQIRLRYDTTGASATTSSTEMGTLARITADLATSGPVIPAILYYAPSADQTLSLLVTLQRTAGSGTLVLFANSSNLQFHLVIKDIGADPGDTGADL